MAGTPPLLSPATGTGWWDPSPKRARLHHHHRMAVGHSRRLAAAAGSMVGLPQENTATGHEPTPGAARDLGRGGPPSGGTGEQGITQPRCCESPVSRAQASVPLPARDGPGGGRAWRAESKSQGVSGLSAPRRPQPPPPSRTHSCKEVGVGKT